MVTVLRCMRQLQGLQDFFAQESLLIFNLFYQFFAGLEHLCIHKLLTHHFLFVLSLVVGFHFDARTWVLPLLY